MAQKFYQGFHNDMEAGVVTDGVDLRCMAVMSNTTIDTEDAETLSDFTTVDECDGVGYAQADLTNVTVAYDASNERHMQIDADDFDLDGGGDSVDTASRNVTRLLYFRYVDGTDANDVPWMSIDVGPYLMQGGAFDVIVNTTGIYYHS
jgi:hypothetical protein